MAFEAPTKVRLLGQRWPAITATVDLELPPYRDLAWEAGVDFVIEDGLPFGLPGDEGFLSRWAVSFNAYTGYVVVERPRTLTSAPRTTPSKRCSTGYLDPYEPQLHPASIPRAPPFKAVRKRPAPPLTCHFGSGQFAEIRQFCSDNAEVDSSILSGRQTWFCKRASLVGSPAPRHVVGVVLEPGLDEREVEAEPARPPPTTCDGDAVLSDEPADVARGDVEQLAPSVRVSQTCRGVRVGRHLRDALLRPGRRPGRRRPGRHERQGRWPAHGC